LNTVGEPDNKGTVEKKNRRTLAASLKKKAYIDIQRSYRKSTKKGGEEKEGETRGILRCRGGERQPR